MSSRGALRLASPKSLSLAVVGQALTALSSVGQSLLIVAIAGEGTHTDAFLAAYTAYLPVGTLAATLRISGIPLSGDGGKHASRNLTGLALMVGLGFLSLSPLIALVVGRSLPASAYPYVLLSLGVLSAAGVAHLAAAGRGAALSARRELPTSNLIYAVSGLVGLAVSAVALVALGAVGAGLGVFCTGLLILVVHLGVARKAPGAPWWPPMVGRHQWRLLGAALSAAAIPVSVQLHLVVVLAFAPEQSGTIVGLTYAFLFLSLVLASSHQVVGAMGLARMVSLSSALREAYAARVVTMGFPVGLLLSAPVAVAAIVVGPDVGDVTPAEIIPPLIVDRILDYLGPMAIVAVPWGLQTLLFPCALATDRVRPVVRALPLSFLALLVSLLILRPTTPADIAIALFVAESVQAGAMLWIIFHNQAAVIFRHAGMRSLPIIAGAAGLLAVGRDGPGAALVAGIGCAFLLGAGVVLSRRFDLLLNEG